MTYGIRLGMVRNLSPNFQGTESMPNVDSLWKTIGACDYLYAKGVNSFPELAPSTEFSAGQAPAGIRETLLVPCPIAGRGFPEQTDVRKHVEADLTRLKSCQPTERLLVLNMTVSAIAIDSFIDFEAFLYGKAAIEAEVYSICEEGGLARGKFNTYWTLGGADLCLLAFLSDIDSIKRVLSCVQKIRSLKKGYLVSRQDYRSQRFSSDHHVFATIDSIFGFQSLSDLKHDQSQGLCITTRLAVSPGHEPRYIKQNKNESLTWTSDSVSMRFDDLEKFANAVESFESNSQGDFCESSSRIEFPATHFLDLVDHEEWLHPRYRLTKDAVLALSAITSSQSSGVSQVVGLFPHRQIEIIYGVLRNAVVKNERLGCIRDLLPFLRQLSACFARPEWESFLCENKEFSLEDTNNSFAHLVEHLWRAIRNRIESRLGGSSDSLLTSAQDGIDKLVNAYSVVAWVAWELFSKEPNSDSSHNVYCASEDFAACVCAGYSGRVYCSEIFQQFRRYIEMKGKASLNSIDSDVGNIGIPWKSRLLLLDVSGPVLFRPELAFVHAFHEMAEFSEWQMLRGAKDLRREINELSGDLLLATILSAIESHRARFTDSSVEFSGDYAEHVRAIWQAAVLKDKPLENAGFPETRERLQSVFTAELESSCEPADFLRTLATGLPRIQSEEWWNFVQQKNRSLASGDASAARDEMLRCFETQSMNEHASPSKIGKRQTISFMNIEESVKHYSYLLREVIADHGMVLSLYHILRESCGVSLKEMKKHVNYIYSGFIDSVFACFPANNVVEKLLKTLIIRWSVQHRSLDPHDSVSTWQGEFLGDSLTCFRQLDSYNEYLKVLSLDDDNDGMQIRQWLAKVLVSRGDYWIQDSPDHSKDGKLDLSLVLHRSFSAKQPRIWLPPVDTPQRRILREFSELWCTAVEIDRNGSPIEIDRLSQMRAKFGFLLWAKSQKLVVAEMFEAINDDVEV